MSRSAVEVVIELLDVFTMVALVARGAKEPLFEDAVLAVPHAQTEAKTVMVVREATNAVFAPAIGPGACMLVGEVSPGISVGRVVFADRGLPVSAESADAPGKSDS